MRIIVMCSVIAAALASSGGAYEILVMGDTHYTSASTRNGGVKWTGAQQGSYTNTLRRWQEHIPGLLHQARERAGRGVDFVVHTGDMIFGECGDGELQERAAREGLHMMATNFPAPFYLVKGNHEVRNDFAYAAFEKVLRPYQEQTFRQTNGVGKAANYAMLHKDDLYIIFDFTQPDLAFVEKTLAAHQAARHVLFFSHSPVIPCNFSVAPVSIFDKPAEDGQRRKLIALLAGRNAVAVCGHLHRYNFLRYQAAEGTITQVCVFSMAPGKVSSPVPRKDGDGMIFINHNLVAKALTGDSPYAKTLRGIFEGMTAFSDFGANTGFAVLRIDDKEIWTDFYFYGIPEPAAAFQLKP